MKSFINSGQFKKGQVSLRSGKIEAHHILPWRNYPELRYEVNNGITLCHKHHPRGIKNEQMLSPYLQELIKFN